LTSSENTSFARRTLLHGIISSALRSSRKYTQSSFLINLSTPHEAIREHENTAPRIHNIDNQTATDGHHRANATLSWDATTLYPPNSRPSRHHSPSRDAGEYRNLLSLLAIETKFLGRRTRFKSVPSNQQFQTFFRTTPRVLSIARDMFRALFSITVALSKKSEN